MAGEATSTATATAAAAGVTKGEFEELRSKLDAVIEALHSGGREAVAEKLSADTTIADQVQAELDRRDESAKREAERADLTTVKEELAKLREAVPAAVLPRRTKFLFGNPDRAAGK